MTRYIRILSIFFLLAPSAVLAEGGYIWQEKLDEGVAGSGLLGVGDPNFEVAAVIAGIIQIALSLLGILFTVLIIIAGFRWMTAGGSADRVKEAKQQIVNSTIGLLIVLGSYAVVRFVLFRISEIQGP